MAVVALSSIAFGELRLRREGGQCGSLWGGAGL
jgi:hypothetical protein